MVFSKGEMEKSERGKDYRSKYHRPRYRLLGKPVRLYQQRRVEKGHSQHLSNVATDKQEIEQSDNNSNADMQSGQKEPGAGPIGLGRCIICCSSIRDYEHNILLANGMAETCNFPQISPFQQQISFQPDWLNGTDVNGVTGAFLCDICKLVAGQFVSKQENAIPRLWQEMQRKKTFDGEQSVAITSDEDYQEERTSSSSSSLQEDMEESLPPRDDCPSPIAPVISDQQDPTTAPIISSLQPVGLEELSDSTALMTLSSQEGSEEEPSKCISSSQHPPNSPAILNSSEQEDKMQASMEAVLLHDQEMPSPPVSICPDSQVQNNNLLPQAIPEDSVVLLPQEVPEEPLASLPPTENALEPFLYENQIANEEVAPIISTLELLHNEELVPTQPPDEVPPSPTPEETPPSPPPDDVPRSPTPDEVPNSPTPDEVPTSPTPEETPPSPPPEDVPTSPTPEETPPSPPPEDVPRSPTPDDIPPSPTPEEAPPSLPSEEVLSSPPPDDVPSYPPPEEVPSTPPLDDVPRSPTLEEVPSSPPPDDVTPSQISEETLPSPPPDEVPPCPSSEEVPSSPTPNEVPPCPPSEEVPSSPTPNEVPSSPTPNEVLRSPTPEEVPPSQIPEETLPSPPPNEVPSCPPSEEVPSSPPPNDAPRSPPPDEVPPSQPIATSREITTATSNEKPKRKRGRPPKNKENGGPAPKKKKVDNSSNRPTLTPLGRQKCILWKQREGKLYFRDKEVEKGAGGNFLCPASPCTYSCKSKHTLSRHYNRAHADSSSGYQCEYCDNKYFYYHSDLELHMIKQHGDGFQCTICKVTLCSQISLRHHRLVTHNRIKPHFCDYCGRCFGSKKEMTVHIRKHTGEKPYVCQVCNVRYACRQSLKRHLPLRHSVTTTVPVPP